MALEILKNNQTLTLQGTTISFDSIYSRLELACFPSGKNMQVAFYNYQTQDTYSSGSSNIRISELPLASDYVVNVSGGEVQGLQLAHEKAKAELESIGYTVNIVEL